MNLGESFEQVAEREVFEEIGLRVSNLKMLHVFSGEEYYMQTSNGDEMYCVTAVFTTKDVTGTLQLDAAESLEVQYFHVEQLPKQMVGSHRRFIELFKTEL